jgi:hypothetical protein
MYDWLITFYYIELYIILTIKGLLFCLKIKFDCFILNNCKIFLLLVTYSLKFLGYI